MFKSRTLVLGCLTASLALSVAACGSSDQSSSNQASGADVAAGLKTAQQNIDAATKIPVFKAPGKAFNAKATMAGKTIWSVPVNATTDFSQLYAEQAGALAKKVGFNFQTWQNSGSPSDWARGIEHAVSVKAAVIDLFAGIDPKLVAPQIAEAKAAKIPVMSSDTYDVSQSTSPLLSGAIKLPNAEAARLDADWVAVDTKGSGHVLFISSSDVVSSAAAQAAFKDELGKVAPNMQAKYIDVPVADWSTKITPQVQSALVADPKIKYVVPVYDSMSPYVITAIQQTGNTGKTFIATYNGTPSMLKLMSDGDFIRMDVGQPNGWVAALILDQEMRAAGGLPTNPEATWGLRVWTKGNLDEAGTPPQAGQGYGNAYVTGFDKLWGLN